MWWIVLTGNDPGKHDDNNEDDNDNNEDGDGWHTNSDKYPWWFWISKKMRYTQKDVAMWLV